MLLAPLPVREPLPLVPEVEPVEPAVEPDVVPPVEPLAVEPLPVEDEPEPDPLMLAFVKMNDAPEPDPEPLRDAVDPDAVDPLPEPVVPVAPLMSPRCRQPVTVMAPPCVPFLPVVCCDALECGSLL